MESSFSNVTSISCSIKISNELYIVLLFYRLSFRSRSFGFIHCKSLLSSLLSFLLNGLCKCSYKERYREDQHGPCERMTCNIREMVSEPTWNRDQWALVGPNLLALSMGIIHWVFGSICGVRSAFYRGGLVDSQRLVGFSRPKSSSPPNGDYTLSSDPLNGIIHWVWFCLSGQACQLSTGEVLWTVWLRTCRGRQGFKWWSL